MGPKKCVEDRLPSRLQVEMGTSADGRPGPTRDSMLRAARDNAWVL